MKNADNAKGNIRRVKVTDNPDGELKREQKIRFEESVKGATAHTAIHGKEQCRKTRVSVASKPIFKISKAK